jgi:hypothetical protein
VTLAAAMMLAETGDGLESAFLQTSQAPGRIVVERKLVCPPLDHPIEAEHRAEVHDVLQIVSGTKQLPAYQADPYHWSCAPYLMVK